MALAREELPGGGHALDDRGFDVAFLRPAHGARQRPQADGGRRTSASHACRVLIMTAHAHHRQRGRSRAAGRLRLSDEALRTRGAARQGRPRAVRAPVDAGPDVVEVRGRTRWDPPAPWGGSSTPSRRPRSRRPEAERAVVFSLEEAASCPWPAPAPRPSSIDDLASTAEAVIERKVPAAVADTDGRVMLGAPLFVGGRTAGRARCRDAVGGRQRTTSTCSRSSLAGRGGAQEYPGAGAPEKRRRLAALGRMAAPGGARAPGTHWAASALRQTTSRHRLGKAGDTEGSRRGRQDQPRGWTT